MKKKTIGAIFLLFLLGPVQAEVYKWVDENGKLQFSDKPPAEKNAEDIGKTLEKTNVDYESKKLGSIGVTNREKTQDEKNLELQKKAKLEEAIGPRCKKFKEDIASIERGDRGTFHDENGNEEIVLERDRAGKLEEWKEKYRNSGCEKLYPLE